MSARSREEQMIICSVVLRLHFTVNKKHAHVRTPFACGTTVDLPGWKRTIRGEMRAESLGEMAGEDFID